MEDVEAAWLAGLFDGDGNLNYERRAYRDDHRNVTSPGSWRCRVRIGTSCRITADRLVALAGGTYHESTTPTGRPHYSWSVDTRRGRETLLAIQPYVVTKKRRVDLAIEAEQIRQKASAAGRRRGISGRGSALADEAHSRLQAISDEIKSLNYKGPKARRYGA